MKLCFLVGVYQAEASSPGGIQPWALNVRGADGRDVRHWRTAKPYLCASEALESAAELIDEIQAREFEQGATAP